MHAYRSDFTLNVPAARGWCTKFRAWRDAHCLLSSLLATPEHLVLAGGSDIIFCPSVTATHSLVVGHGVIEMTVGGMYSLAAMTDTACCMLLELSISMFSCTVIAQIAAVQDDAVRQSIVAAGGVRALLVLLTSPRLAICPDARWVYQDACIALGFLSSSGATVQQRIADEGGVAALEHVLAWQVLNDTTWYMPTPLCVERAGLVLHTLRTLDAPQ